MSTKNEIRERMRKILADTTSEQVAAESLRASHHLFAQKEYIKAEVVMVFLSMPHEVDTAPLVLRAWQDRKRVLAPKVSWNQRRMVPIEIRSLTDDVTETKFGIREPAAGIPFPIELIDLVIAPGLAFDEFGNRLGRGRGFYDRFLAHPDFHGASCGWAMERQILASLPVGPLDRQVDMLVTDARVRRFKHSPTPPT